MIKRLIVIAIVAAAYAGSLLWKGHQVELAKQKDIPTMFKFRAEKGTPVRTSSAQKRAFVRYVTVTGRLIESGKVEASVAPEVATQIRIGADSYIGDGAERVTGVVQHLAREVNLLSGLHSLVVSLPSNVKIPSSVQINIEVNRRNGVLTLEREAVSTRGGTPHVYVVENQIVARRDIKLAGSNNEYYAIASGLREGETVVLSDQRYLSEGERILALEQ